MKFIILSLLILTSTVTESKDYEYPLFDAAKPTVYKARRERLISSLSEKSAIIIFSSHFFEKVPGHELIPRNRNIYYLTGMTEQKSILILSKAPMKAGISEYNELVFIKNQNEEDILWNGKKIGPKEGESILRIKKSFDLQDYRALIPQIIKNIDTIFIPGLTSENYDDAGNKRILAEPNEIGIIRKIKPELVFESSLNELAKMRSIKDSTELVLMQKAIDISIEAHLDVMKNIQVGMYEFQLQSIFEYKSKFRGAESQGYAPVIAAGRNTCYLHYTQNRSKLFNGDLVLLDCGASYRGYTADITRTLPANGKFTEEQSIIYNAVLSTQDSVIKLCRKGFKFLDLGVICQSIISNKLMELGIIKNVAEARNYMPHGVSHYLGLDVHDVGTFSELESGNIITVEPGIYIPFGSPCERKWWGIGIRIEDDILITDNDPVVLSASLPKRIDDIEKIINSEKEKK